MKPVTSCKTKLFDPIKILSRVGVVISPDFFIENNTIRGIFKAVKVKGFGYRSLRHPWDTIPWLRDGSGGGDGNGSWEGSFHIEIPKLPEEFQKRFILAAKSVEAAEMRMQAAVNKCKAKANAAYSATYDAAALECDIDNLRSRATELRQALNDTLCRSRA